MADGETRVGTRAEGRSPRRRERPSTARRRTLLVEATVVMEARYADPDLSGEQVARRIATSVRQLQRVFAELADTTFRDELNAVRMQHAATLMLTTDLPVREIATRVGHRQPSHFAKAFRRHHGLPPSAFRVAVLRERRSDVGGSADTSY